MVGKWQVVRTKADRKRTSKDEAPKAAANGHAPKAIDVRAKAAFADLDAWEKPEPASFSSLTPPKEPRAAKSVAQNGVAVQHAERPVPPKKPKQPKKPKVSPGDVRLDAGQLRRALEAIAAKYPGDDASQLGAAADWFVSAFKSAELPFNKAVTEGPLEKAADVPYRYLSSDVAVAAAAFFAAKDVAALAAVAATLVGAVFEGVPESSATAPPKAKVGALVALALLLRASPGALLRLSPDLLAAGGTYSSPRRLPFLLWIIHQAARGDVGAAAAVWARVLLPQVLGAPLPARPGAPAPPQVLGAPLPARPGAPAPPPVHKLGAAGAATALKYAGALLGEGAAASPERSRPAVNEYFQPEWNGGTTALGPDRSMLAQAARRGVLVGGGTVEAVVPPAAVEAVVRAGCCDPPAFGPTESRIRLLNLLGSLRELCVAGGKGGGVDVKEAVRLALATAGGAEPLPGGAGDQGDLVAQACATLVEWLAERPDEAAAAWADAHKGALRGSARVLTRMAAGGGARGAKLLPSPAARRAFAGLLKELPSRHAAALRTGGKAAPASPAAAADAAVKTLSAALTLRAAAAAGLRTAALAASVAALAAGVGALTLTEAGRELVADVVGPDAARRAGASAAAVAKALKALLAEGGAAMGTLRTRAAPYVDAAISAVGSYGEAAAAQVGAWASGIGSVVRQRWEAQ
ncbi:hypothetical protein WJX81_004370 [Elliptochloris bilobata]|uniref:Uncharacterized protein n=1 Tax=Elliptochloris bilobata TaxID=381761 RepID=A0AAW1RDG1_9CHLO